MMSIHNTVSTKNQPFLIQRAIDEAYAVQREEQAARAQAERRAKIKDAYKWGRRVALPVRGRARDTLMALVWLCGRDSDNGAERWRCEPRIASIAKRTGQAERTVKYHLAAFEDAGLIARAGIPGRKRTRGRSCNAVYLCVYGREATECAMENDGLWTPETPANDDVAPPEKRSPDGATFAPVLVRYIPPIPLGVDGHQGSPKVPPDNHRTQSGEIIPFPTVSERNPPPREAEYEPSHPVEIGDQGAER
jgi:DNA-binding transcriptional ArsR family regulator